MKYRHKYYHVNLLDVFAGKFDMSKIIKNKSQVYVVISIHNEVDIVVYKEKKNAINTLTEWVNKKRNNVQLHVCDVIG